jgi:ribosomal protein S18 acetylase RimI-like enzyme
MVAILIRKAAIDDLEQIAVLFNDYRQFYEKAYDLELATHFIKNRLVNQDSIIFVALNHEQKLIGFCQLYPTFCSVMAAPICVLYDLFVDVSARKTGAGKLLMLAAHEYAENNGFARLDLTTAKTNLVAQSLYETLGWERDEVFYTYTKVIRSCDKSSV